MRRITPSNDAVMRIFKKDPNAVLDYGFDWSDWLDEVTDESISTSTWTVPSGITKDSDSKMDGITTIWLSGGTAGETYLIANRIVTSASRTEDRSFKAKVVER